MSKTKLEDVVSKAKNSLSNAKSAVNNITAKNGSDTVIPGFSDYAVNAAGQVVSRKTNKVQQIPKGKKKYLIYNDKGERKSISLDEIKEKTKTTTKKADKVKGERGETKKDKILALHAEGKTAKQISDDTGFKYNSVYVTIKVHTILTLNKKGLTPKQIAEKTGFSEVSVIWQINK